MQIKANQRQALGVQVQLAYQITQHNKDEQLMTSAAAELKKLN